ncbi:SDR family oxidoreductase [Peribacillus muralis]|uniref:SDR family NAD(P)-dependent oxidoreductase n=1 Tax=Peribacillus muralis TaxID=264697 RepID=UPI001F4E6D54|nr:SDR family oxidoreductase [Peribacillus muralis]MCK1992933.1 SDR family oxidoreductase [Peribacillus muralis]MCK2013488.1 SDR family oxidoreductase [Peribacillus muralis]
MRFKNKTAIVTGGATGIGLATAQLFAEEGASVIIAGRSAKNGEDAVKRLRDAGGIAHFVPTDVTNEEDVQNLVKETIRLEGKIDILVNNAALFHNSSFIEETTENWKKVFNVIVDGTYLCTKYVGKEMIQHSEGGAIVNISSINAYRALEWSSHYNTAKGALDQLTRCTALELSPYNIRVNGVAPGFIETPMTVVGGVNEHETEYFKHYYVGKRKIALARPGTPEEIANAIAFLASNDSSYMTGATIPVDGGLSITF